MAIGLSVDLAVLAMTMAILYYVAREGDWLKMLAKYMFIIVAVATAIQLSLDYNTSTYPLIFTALILFFIGIFIFELMLDLYKIVTMSLIPILHKRFR
jgi:hypothetical protein